MKRNKPRQNIIKAFNAAIEGVIYTFKHERNMKIHYVIAVVVLLISLFLNLSRVEMMILLLSISLVIVSEMFNTAVENAVDLITNEIHPLAKIAKDVAAGGVLIASLNIEIFTPTSRIKNIILWISERSYSIYLTHIPVYFLTQEIIFKINKYEILNTNNNYIYIIIATLLVPLVAHCSYRYIENPLRVYGREKINKKIESIPVWAFIIMTT